MCIAYNLVQIYRLNYIPRSTYVFIRVYSVNISNLKLDLIGITKFRTR